MALLSIVTACYNRVDVVAEAVESVLQQDHGPVEHIVIDGGSTDGTLEVLGRYPHLRVLSEPDRGVYDAINKGLRMVRGKVIGLLNSDDRYEPNTFGRALEALSSAPEAPGAAGGARIFENVRGEERTVRIHDERSMKVLELPSITRGVPAINARFFRRQVFEQVGRFDLTYQVAADRDFLLRAWLNGIRFVPVDEVLYHYRRHPNSLTITGAIASSTTDEHIALCERYLSNPEIPDELRHELVRWRAQQIGRAVRGALAAGDLEAAVERSSQGFRLDPTWPVRFAVHGLARRLRAEP